MRTFFDAVDLHREDKFVALRFRSPFRVISTCHAHGGIRDELDLVFNHQSCEPKRHMMPELVAAHRHADAYHAQLMRRYGLEGCCGAGLGTAANMNNLCCAEATYCDLSVVALATGGVEVNAARAGDPASYYEYNGQFEKRGDIGPETPGTINVMVLINTPLIDGALVRAVMTATEAKTAALQELSVVSRQSQSMATGTGTDQIAVSAPCKGAPPLTSAGHHSVLGELIGRTVHDAVKQTLTYQNRLTAVSQGSIGRLLERFGLTTMTFAEAVAQATDPHAAALATDNALMIDQEPLTVAAVAALIHIYDQVQWGMLPPLVWREAAVNHGSMIAAAAAGRLDRQLAYRDSLAQRVAQSDRDGPAYVVVQAVALGYGEKWQATQTCLADTLSCVPPLTEAAQ